ncbi:YfiR family protein [Prosthecobacter sp. SYSU 5D2]|uniref:YfiR family protein n=1 Tax=Prosthecobacter sp. SYSU 5D2 TaxID=3134134 RepID=UPI0031FE4BAC
MSSPRQMPSVNAPANRRRVLAWLALLAVPAGVVPAAGAVTKEHQIKAAFLYNFTKFITWPAQRPGRPEPVFVIGILGRNPFGTELENIARGRKVSGLPLQIRYLKSVNEAPGVDLLFVASGEEALLGTSLSALHEASVLTVGESASFAKLGGIINFRMVEDKIRFEIYRDAGARARLKISPQLLKLAITARKDKS